MCFQMSLVFDFNWQFFVLFFALTIDTHTNTFPNKFMIQQNILLDDRE